MEEQRKLPERSIIDAFHNLARESLAQANADGLIDDAFLNDATEEELQILGPALTLLFAAWKNVTDPPSVAAPRSSAGTGLTLSVSTCPTNLLPLFRRWQRTVQPLQRLSTEQAHDVARLICDLEPASSPVSTLMVKLAADIQALAIQISQRKTFMERYTQDLEAALHKRSPSFQRPPGYGREGLSASDEPRASSTHQSTAWPSQPISTDQPTQGHTSGTASMQSPDKFNLPVTEDPDMISIRETLYAVLADVLAQSRTLSRLMQADPARGYFTAIALAVIEEALNCLTPDGERVRVVGIGRNRPQSFGSLDAPPAYRVFVRAIVGLGAILRELEEKDNNRAVELAMAGQDDTASLTRIEMLKEELESGPPDSDSVHEAESAALRDTAELRSIANQVNRMALAITSLPGFQERTAIFSILQGVSQHT